jgi:hypothetical protein
LIYTFAVATKSKLASILHLLLYTQLNVIHLNSAVPFTTATAFVWVLASSIQTDLRKSPQKTRRVYSI